MKSKGVIISRTAALALMVGLLSAPAYAGFEWSPPPAVPAVNAAANTGPAVPAAPPTGVDKMELMPIPGTNEAPVFEESAPVVAEPVSTEPTAPQIEKETTALPTVKASQDASTPPAYDGPFSIAQGFGTDIPLALALGQIVPGEFAYSFASNVNPGLKISWDGGKPWNDVLNEALKPHSLRADIIGTVVMVRNGTAGESTDYVPVPLEQDHSTLSITPRPPADAPVDVSGTQVGEGTANKYPRRTPPTKNFFGSIFTPAEAKGNQAPRPPVDGKVTIENEVPPESMGISQQSSAADVASLAPAAPAVTAPIPSAPTPLTSQKISYADESMRDAYDTILPERDVSQNIVAAPKMILDADRVGLWQADSNRNLQEVLQEWAQKADVELIWDSGYNYKLPTSISMEGTFAEAVTKVFSLYGTAEPRPQGKLHPNLPKGPSVLLVENYP